MGIPVRKVPEIMWELAGIRITQSALTQDALRRADSGPLLDRYGEIGKAIQQAGAVHADGTGWKKAGAPAWLIVFATPSTEKRPGETLYVVRDHHSAEVILDVLGKDFAGVLITDRGIEFDAKVLEHLRKQKCCIHIHRTIKEILRDKHNAARDFGEGLLLLLLEARRLQRDWKAGRRDNYSETVACLEDRLTVHLRPRTLTDPDNQRLLNEIGKQHDRGSVLRFLHEPGLPSDNNTAEQQIRFAVIARKVSHCSKNERGAHAHAVHSSVGQTERRRKPSSLLNAVVGYFRRPTADARPQAP